MITIQLQLSGEDEQRFLDQIAQRLNTQPAKDGLSMEEAAERLGVSKATVWRRIKAGIIPVIPGVAPARVPTDFVSRMMATQPNG